jgi:hypothetical protein
MPNKTKVLKELQIPRKYFFDFLRGHFDGDGTCYGFRDRRYKNSFMFYLSFSSGSLSHLEWLRNRINRYLKIEGSIGRISAGVWKLSYPKGKTKKLMSKMYYKKNLPCLRRKYKKLGMLLKIEKKILSSQIN